MTKIHRIACFALAAALGAACTPTYYMNVTATTPVAAKAATCEFQVVNLAPSGDYEEIATLAPDAFGVRDAEMFKHGVQADVCRVGGDVVVTEINGKGEYVRGTVLRKRAPAA